MTDDPEDPFETVPRPEAPRRRDPVAASPPPRNDPSCSAAEVEAVKADGEAVASDRPGEAPPDPFAAAGDPETPPPDAPRPEQPPETPPDAPPETPPGQPPEGPPDSPPERPEPPEEIPPEVPPETDPNAPDPDAPPPETPPEPPSEDPFGPPRETPPGPPPEAPEPPSEVPPAPPPETPPTMGPAAATKTVATVAPLLPPPEGSGRDAPAGVSSETEARGPAPPEDAPEAAAPFRAADPLPPAAPSEPAEAAPAPTGPPAADPAQPARRSSAQDDLDDLVARPWAWDLFAAVEAVHAARPDLPAPGRSSRIADDPVRLRQRPTLAFKASPIVAARRSAPGGRPVIELEQIAFGPLGPAGPLPVHVTDDAIHEAKEGRPWLSGFLDVFTHRMLHLMVRAWQSARLASRQAFTADDPWPRRIASLFGAGPAEFRNRDAFPDDLKLHMAGWLASKRRSKAALAGVLEAAVGAPVEVQEHAPEWLPMPKEEQSRLGAQGATLGRDLTLGPRFFSLQSRLRVRTAPLDAEAFADLLPGGPRLAAARDAARMLMGLAASWELQLRLKPEAVPDLALDGRRRLGLDSWLAAETRRLAEDVVLEGAAPPRAVPRLT
ncbi:MAG: type VI secretion system baseplate subunit TssG [Paracoccaceae bacterium]